MTDLSVAQGTVAEPIIVQESILMLENALEDLSTKSTLDMFRMFFDIKPAHWEPFQKMLGRHVQVNYSWGMLRDDEEQRRECAETFLDEIGLKCWGTSEGREKYLVEERVKNGDCCVYPTHKKQLTEALVKFLEKKAKNRRESVAQNGMSSRQDAPQSSDTIMADTEAVPGVSSTLQDTPVASPVVKPEESLATTQPAPRVQGRPLFLRLGDTGQSQAHQSNARGSSTFGFPNFWNQPLLLAYNPNVHSGSSQTATAAELQRATFFLIRCEDNVGLPQHVCVPFEFFRTADEFLDRMAKKVADSDLILGQITRDMPQLQRRQVTSAVVHICWSGVSFVIRRGANDLQALMDRVGCAWSAKNKGELHTFEFQIEVSLRVE